MADLNTNWWAETERDPIHLAAADWLVRLQHPQVSLEETLAWQAWMKEDDRHAQAFARIETVSQIMPLVNKPRDATARERARDLYDASLPLKEWRQPRGTVRTLALAASIALLVVSTILTLRMEHPLFHTTTESSLFTTAVGENRAISLGDGSKVTLGGSSSLSVSLTAHGRDLELVRGEALFNVAKDPARPFRVRARNATIVALGTEFDVRQGSDGAVVSVTQGRVMVEPATRFIPAALLREFKPKLRPVRVDAGQQTLCGSAGIEGAFDMADPAAATSWQSGQLSFRLKPLRDVLEDVNRYSPKPIVLDDDELGTLVITGMMTRDNVTGWITSLERAFSLQAVDESDRIVLRRR